LGLIRPRKYRLDDLDGLLTTEISLLVDYLQIYNSVWGGVAPLTQVSSRIRLELPSAEGKKKRERESRKRRASKNR